MLSSLAHTIQVSTNVVRDKQNRFVSQVIEVIVLFDVWDMDPLHELAQ